MKTTKRSIAEQQAVAAELTLNEMNLAAHTRWMESAIEHGNKEGASHHAGMANHYAALVAEEKRQKKVQA